MDIPPIPISNTNLPVDDAWGKVLILILGAFVGWLFAQGGKLLDEWLKTRKLRKDLLEELRNIQEGLFLLRGGFARSLQLSTHFIVDDDVPFKISTPIYSNFYKDVCSKLNRSQRQSYQMIHGLLEGVNKQIDDQGDIIKDYVKTQTADLMIRRSRLAQAQFHNLRVLEWHVEWHLANPENPELGLGTTTHKQFLLLLGRIDQEIQMILTKAKNLDPKGFEKNYHPENFSHLDDDD